jgi:hypothetical protein
VSKRLRRLIAAAAVVAALIVVALVNTSSGTNVPVAVYPSDGDRAASPTSQISFRGARPSSLTGISVKGSESGDHRGKLLPHSDGLGASFLPTAPFHYGETVTVSADADLVGADGDNKVKFEVTTPVARPRARSTSARSPPSTRRASRSRGRTRASHAGTCSSASRRAPVRTGR